MAANEFYVGRRLSYDGSLCTVKWQGEIEGLRGQWLGVEWDDPSRGKHDGRRGGKRYFDCWSKESSAASFIRPNQKCIDKPQQFLQAVREKYGLENSLEQAKARDIITISGKQVNEVGFEAISKKQSAWSELETVSLDGLRIRGSYPKPQKSKQDLQDNLQTVPFGLKWKELDLSRNLFEDWDDITNICSNLKELELLKVNGNRFKIPSVDEKSSDAFKQVNELSLANTALDWVDVSPNTTLLLYSLSALKNVSQTSEPSVSPSTASTIHQPLLAPSRFQISKRLTSPPATSIPSNPSNHLPHSQTSAP
ncbi:MAG: hypothetical protein Q9200_007377 [Gallowayella weberi]